MTTTVAEQTLRNCLKSLGIPESAVTSGKYTPKTKKGCDALNALRYTLVGAGFDVTFHNVSVAFKLDNVHVIVAQPSSLRIRPELMISVK